MGFFSFIRSHYGSIPEPQRAPDLKYPVVPIPKDGLFIESVRDIVHLGELIHNNGGRFYLDIASKEIRSRCTISGESIPRVRHLGHNPGITINLPGWRFACMHFYDIPGGLKIQSYGNDLVQCEFSEIGEHAISSDVSTEIHRNKLNLFVSNCKFWNSRRALGSTIHLDNPDSCNIVDSFFTGGDVGVSLGSMCDPKIVEAHVRGCEFYAVACAIRAQGRLHLVERFNKYESCRKESIINNGVKVSR